MAIAPSITYTIKDGDQDSATTSLHVPDGDTLQRYGEFAVAHAPILEGVLLGVIEPVARLSIPVDISALTNNLVIASSDVEQVAAFQFADSNGEPVDFNMPGLAQGMILVGSDSLDLTVAAVSDLIAAMEVGLAVTGGTIQPCSIAEASILDTFYARKETKNSGKRRS